MWMFSWKNRQISTPRKKTEGDLKVFMAFLQSEGEQRFPVFIPPSDLNQHISHFILSVREKGGDEFEPSSLRGMISSIDRYLRTKSYGVSIITDITFDKSRSVLKMKLKDLQKLGKGNNPRASISDQDLQKMNKAKTLGADNPTVLLHSMWLICTMHFGMRTGKETHNLQWGDISLQLDDSKQEYIVYNTERHTKARTGVNERNIRLAKPRAYAIPDIPYKDPVGLYKLYKNKRPADMNVPESPFFLSVNVENPKHGQCWYKKTPMGINKLYGILKKMMTDTGLSPTDKRITPYSVRKHLIQKLNDEGIPANQIVQISGHKNINSSNNYINLNPAQSINISNILSNVPALHVFQSVIRETAPPVAPAIVSSSTKEFQSIPGHEFSGILTNAVIHGDVHIQLQQKCETQSLSQTTQYVSGKKAKSSGSVSSQPSEWKRIISSDTDSE